MVIVSILMFVGLGQGSPGHGFGQGAGQGVGQGLGQGLGQGPG